MKKDNGTFQVLVAIGFMLLVIETITLIAGYYHYENKLNVCNNKTNDAIKIGGEQVTSALMHEYIQTGSINIPDPLNPYGNSIKLVPEKEIILKNCTKDLTGRTC